MNDPHVAALIYKVRHHDGVDYGKAEPLEHEEEGFRLELKDGVARFEMKGHHSTGQGARNVVEPFIRDWEFDACFGHRHERFHLDFDRPEIIDRNPAKDVVSLFAHASLGPVTASARLVVGYASYPPVPLKIKSGRPDVRTLEDRYRRYREGEERLPAFAYDCFTELCRQAGGGVPEAARRYSVSKPVLNAISRLSSLKGGSEARKAVGSQDPYSTEERQFLETALRRLIRRVGEYHGGNGDLPQITMADFQTN